MFDHIGFAVTDFARSRAFYARALAPLGVTVVREVTPEQTGAGAHVAFGVGGRPFFWIGTGRALTGRLHVAFAADDRESVDAFYRAALAAAGVDNGPPGLRPHYHANYYGAFVPVPRTRSSHDIAASTVANFGFKSGTRIIDLLVSL